MLLEKFIPKGKIENFYSVSLFWNRRNVLIGLNYTKLQKTSAQYKHSLYNQLGIAKCSTQYNLLRIAENKCSTPYITYTE